ncbi:unnamed protein product [Toxocara canis]|uniref:SCP domain-containing protein n=1 Tax=Toxocara canis TaxID=6265 RepID=A0A183UPF3_TOXCA|nr:unnamed protein product [Toxocara canis]
MALSPAIRSAIVTQHNQLRSSLAKGLEPTVRGENAPSGKNIYKLSYDCKLEAQAQKWSNECTFQHSNIALRNASENLFWAWGNDISAVTTIPKAISWWWNELSLIGISDPQNRLTFDVFRSGVGHFTAVWMLPFF